MIHTYIYHICDKQSWHDQIKAREYRHVSLVSENFIHCSELDQIQGVLDRYFQDAEDLLLLTIDKSRLVAKCLYEKAPNGELFPHIYGPINKDAIVDIKKIKEAV